ncbi:uncharacterized protein LOC125842861 [Solanum stenotomum]|uniref:uncharacterized protein LOC125842861 n=1 Tax=Solanum stenotomum TaxID=172797 RepID=UPI0020D115B4|nr:uncharacterized protein LOC125842861 [Solanum stenotomum]
MEVQQNKQPKTTERALRRVQKFVASTNQIQDEHAHEPQVKKRKKSVKRIAISEVNDDGAVINCNLTTTSSHKLEEEIDCTYCNALRFQYEPPTFCCGGGCISLAPNEVADDFYELFVSDSEDAKLFRKNIRAYNSIFAFTSFGVKLDKELASSRKGVYSFKAQGQIYHDLPSLIPNNDKPRYFQLYFYDTDHELANRMSVLEDANLSEEVMIKIRNIMEMNPYAKFFSQLKEHTSFQNMEIRIAANASLDQRVYNKPSVDQVAAIWVDGNNPIIPFERDIAVHEHSGEGGWHQGIQKCRNPIKNSQRAALPSHQIGRSSFTNAAEMLAHEEQGVRRETKGSISCREYYCYKLQVRTSDKSILLLCGRLLQQFVVDIYIKIETTKLEYYRLEKSNYRREILEGIVDSVTAGESRGDKVGQRVLLPGSFIGGPRDMRRCYMDAMALVQKFRRPDLFITMTCNPEWIEIQQALLPGQLPQDRPNLVTRVFRAKLQDLKDQIFKKEIFGTIAAHVFVVEFQKRGLPHIHLLLIFKEGNKIRSADEYDRYISAEILDSDTHPELSALVVRHMIHGPCGEKRKTSPCMKDGQCKFHYPRAFNNKTIQEKDGYPIYKRRNDGKTSEVREMKMNNQWVVPYNPYLLMRYNCHINVEAAKERGLLESDNSISECLREAVTFKMPSALRCLFATILARCNPTDVRCLWDTYYGDMSEDFQRSHSRTTDAPIQCTLKSINYYLESMGQSVDKYDIPQIKQQPLQTEPRECREIIEEMSVKVPAEDVVAQSKLNQEQA